MKRILLILSLVVLSGCGFSPLSDKTEVSDTPAETQAETNHTLNSKLEAPTTVKIVKFFDYKCGHCRDAHYTTQRLKEQFGDQVEFELKHYPLSAATFLVAETAECARRQGLFEPYHDVLIEENFGHYDPENLQRVALEVGLDIDQYNTCAANGAGKSEVQADVDEAKSLGVSGTPYFLVNDSIPVPGAIPEKSFARLIQQVLDGESL